MALLFLATVWNFLPSSEEEKNNTNYKMKTVKKRG